MQIIKIDIGCYLVEYKYKDFLRIGYEFQRATIVSLDRYEHGGETYIRVKTEPSSYKI